MAVRVTVIIPTAGRESYRDAVEALGRQTLPRSEWELLGWLKGPGDLNQYDQENKAARRARGDVLAFCDDDTLPPPEWVERGLRQMDAHPEAKIMTGPLEGDLWGRGQKMRLAKPGWFVGANLWVRKDAFFEVGGFDADWGLHPPPDRGWRSDTDLGWRMLDRWGPSCYLYAEDVVMVHPRNMTSVFLPDVEKEFYLRHRRRCLDEFCPVDSRLCQFVLANRIETDPATVEYLTGLLRGFEKVYGVKLVPA